MLDEWTLAQTRRSPRTIEARSRTVRHRWPRRQFRRPGHRRLASQSLPASSTTRHCRTAPSSPTSARRSTPGSRLAGTGEGRASGQPDRRRVEEAPHPTALPAAASEHRRARPGVLARVNRRRTRAMVLLAAYEGMRVHEIAKLRGQDFRARMGGTLLEIVGKGGHKAAIPVHPVITQLRSAYPRAGWWFPSYRDEAVPLTAKNVSARWLVRRCGGPKGEWQRSSASTLVRHRGSYSSPAGNGFRAPRRKRCGTGRSRAR